MKNRNIFGWLSDKIFKRAKLVLLITILITMSGITAFNAMHREDLPEVTVKAIDVFISYPNAGPEEVDSQIIKVVEPVLKNVGNIKKINATARENRAEFMLTFPQTVNIEEKLEDVDKVLESITDDLPDDAKEPTSKVVEIKNTLTTELYLLGPQSIESLEKEGERIVERLEEIEGVEKVGMTGQTEERVVIEFDPVKLTFYDINFDQLEKQVSNAFKTLPLGSKTLNGQNARIRFVKNDKTIDEIKLLEIKTGSDIIFLSDVASIENEYFYPDGRVSVEGHSGIKLTVTAADGANLSKVAKAVRNEVTHIQSEIGLYDMDLLIYKDRGVEVDFKLDEVKENAISGLVVVIVVLFIFIGFKESIVAASAIPVSLLLSIIFMNLFHMTFNTVSMAALIISLGMLVDSTIVVLENIVEKKREGKNIHDAVSEGTNQVALAVFAATMTTVSAFLPLLKPAGIMGEFVKVLPQTVIIAILSSFLIAVFFAPTVSSILLKKEKKSQLSKAHRWLSIASIAMASLYAFRVEGSFKPITFIATLLLTGLVVFKLEGPHNKKIPSIPIKETYGLFIRKLIASRKRRFGAMAIAMIILGGSFMLLKQKMIAVTLMPEQDQLSYNMSVSLPVGSTLDKTQVKMSEIESRIKDMDSIDMYAVEVGSRADDIGQLNFKFVPRHERSLNSNDLVEIVKGAIKDIPGIDVKVKSTAMTPENQVGIDFNLASDNYKELIEVSKVLKNILLTRDDVSKVETTFDSGPLELQIQLDSEKISFMGLSESQITQLVKKSLFEEESSLILEDDRHVLLRPLLSRSDDVNEIMALPIGKKDNDVIVLGDVATAHQVKSANAIKKEDGNYVTNFHIESYGDGILSTAYDDVKAFIDSDIAGNVNLYVGGEMADLQESFKEMARNMVIAIFLVYLVLAIQFNSFMQPFVILLSVPFGIAGALYGLWFTSQAFGLFAFLGLIALIGIVVNDSIVLIDFTNQNRKTMSVDEALANACESRMFPVLAASMTTVGGILPLALGSEFYAQIGFALVFGLSFATMLTLIIVPIYYTELESLKNLVERLIDRLKGIKGENNEK